MGHWSNSRQWHLRSDDRARRGTGDGDRDRSDGAGQRSDHRFWKTVRRAQQSRRHSCLHGEEPQVRALELENLSVYYGPVRGVEDVTLHVEDGEVVALLSANGAGKSSLLKAISGITASKSGTIRYFGDDFAKTSAHRRVLGGLVHVPEGRRIFTALTVGENLELGLYGTKVKRTVRADRLAGGLRRFPLPRRDL